MSVTCGALLGCSAIVAPDVDELGLRPATCVLGQQNPSVCEDSAVVIQVCTEEGGFSPMPPCPPTACSVGAVQTCQCSDFRFTTRTCLPQGTWPTCACAGAAAGAPAPMPGG